MPGLEELSREELLVVATAQAKVIEDLTARVEELTAQVAELTRRPGSRKGRISAGQKACEGSLWVARVMS